MKQFFKIGLLTAILAVSHSAMAGPGQNGSEIQEAAPGNGDFDATPFNGRYKVDFSRSSAGCIQSPNQFVTIKAILDESGSQELTFNVDWLKNASTSPEDFVFHSTLSFGQFNLPARVDRSMDDTTTNGTTASGSKITHTVTGGHTFHYGRATTELIRHRDGSLTLKGTLSGNMDLVEHAEMDYPETLGDLVCELIPQ